MTRSIRSRLIISLLLVLTLIFMITAWKSYDTARHESEEIFLAQLASSARVLGALASDALQHSSLGTPVVISLPHELSDDDGSGLVPQIGHEYETKIAFQIWHQDGRLLARSLSAPAETLGPRVDGYSLQQVEGASWQVFSLKSGGTWVQVAAKNEILGELASDIAFSVMIPLIVGSVILLLAANVLVRFGLRPLNELANHISQRNPDSLSEIEPGKAPTEVKPVVQALNTLMAKMRAALERERRFTDAAAHELRTPLAALKIHADNLVRSATEEQRKNSETRLIRGLDRTLRLVHQMLLLARTQNDQGQSEPLHLRLLLAEVMAQQEPLLAQKRQYFEVRDLLPQGQDLLIGQPLKLHQLFGNLFDNASRYGSPDSAIGVVLSRVGDLIQVSIANEGEPVPEEMRDKVFEPYVRVPGTKVEGSGLGLAIVREIADQHGARLSLNALANNKGNLVSVEFPAPAVPIAPTH